jgi:hypothetical protein
MNTEATKTPILDTVLALAKRTADDPNVDPLARELCSDVHTKMNDLSPEERLAEEGRLAPRVLDHFAKTNACAAKAESA